MPGQPRRHLLQSGWSVFVSSKKLVAGDAFLFLRCVVFFIHLRFQFLLISLIPIHFLQHITQPCIKIEGIFVK